jgi:glycogen debranching enzyme
VIVHPWESGMDNSPSWDSALERVPASSHEHIDRRDTRTVAADERPSQDEYRRYLGIVGALRNAGWDSETQAADSPFAVEDPGFTAITAHAAAELASVGAEAGLDGAAMADLSQRSLQGLESLWDEQLGWYRPFDVRAQTPTGPRTSCGAVAMWAGIDHSRAVRVAEQIVAWQRVMPRSVPTTDPADARFEPQRYWRGPVWVLINWLIATGMTSHGLADEADALRNATLQLVEAGFSEYYDPRTGTGIGGEGFSWSAALTLAWLTSDPPF